MALGLLQSEENGRRYEPRFAAQEGDRKEKIDAEKDGMAERGGSVAGSAREERMEMYQGPKGKRHADKDGEKSGEGHEKAYQGPAARAHSWRNNPKMGYPPAFEAPHDEKAENTLAARRSHPRAR